jgi:hypothetical protein
MHVDTLATHVVSAIINVDQDVDEPWELLILDHEDNEHSLQMAPGDMLLYESAKLLHGRPGQPPPPPLLTVLHLNILSYVCMYVCMNIIIYTIYIWYVCSSDDR